MIRRLADVTGQVAGGSRAPECRSARTTNEVVVVPLAVPYTSRLRHSAA